MAPMNRAYWNRSASNYSDDIFSVLRNDRKGTLLRCLDKVASQRGMNMAGDLGCGIGINLPELAKRFRTVHAVDLSPKLLERAEWDDHGFGNIAYRVADLSLPLKGLPPLDFIFNVNVLIAPSEKIRSAILDTLCAALRPGGKLLLVVPSVESVLLTAQRLAEWNRRRRVARLPDKILSRQHPETGIVKIEGVPTKHYLRAEMEGELSARKLQVVETHKIEYEWDTEFDVAPDWMREPYPWDWLFLAKRVR